MKFILSLIAAMTEAFFDSFLKSRKIDKLHNQQMETKDEAISFKSKETEFAQKPSSDKSAIIYRLQRNKQDD